MRSTVKIHRPDEQLVKPATALPSEGEETIHSREHAYAPVDQPQGCRVKVHQPLVMREIAPGVKLHTGETRSDSTQVNIHTTSLASVPKQGRVPLGKSRVEHVIVAPEVQTDVDLQVNAWRKENDPDAYDPDLAKKVAAKAAASVVAKKTATKKAPALKKVAAKAAPKRKPAKKKAVKKKAVQKKTTTRRR